MFFFFLLFFISGSPLFIQTRVGKDEKKFQLFKFRTMKKNTVSVATHLVSKSAITPIGVFLRYTKIDELPQFWNVILGDMSIVGPRPCLTSQKNLIKERKKRKIFNVRPGITGLAQINGIDMSKPLLLAKADLKMLKQMNLYFYFYYLILTLLFFVKKR
jgi:lipopolysaccharide/colanic/teichoic acid biosynthesis glycosyltransferase